MDRRRCSCQFVALDCCPTAAIVRTAFPYITAANAGPIAVAPES